MRKSIISERERDQKAQQFFTLSTLSSSPLPIVSSSTSSFCERDGEKKNFFCAIFAHGIFKFKVLWKKLLNNVIKRAWTESFKQP